MSKSVQFADRENLIKVTLTQKNFPSKGYSQSFLSIKVSQQISPLEQNDPFLDIELDDNYTFIYFENIHDFFSCLSKNRKKEDAVRLINGSEMAFDFQDEQGAEREIIPLNAVRRVEESEFEELVEKIDFQNSPFKTKMINKIGKVVKNHYKKEKKPISLPEDSQVIFSLAQDQPQRMYALNKTNPYQYLPVSFDYIHQKLFKVRLLRMNHEKLYFGLEYAPYGGQQASKQVRRMCQFKRGVGSSLLIEEGQQLAISIEQGQLVICNANTNDGKVFDEEVGQGQWTYRVIISLNYM